MAFSKYSAKNAEISALVEVDSVSKKERDLDSGGELKPVPLPHFLKW